jgi:hypothetical protein
MSPNQKYDFNELLEKAKKIIARGEVTDYSNLARALNVNRMTLMNGFERTFGIRTFSQIEKAQVKKGENKNEPLISTEDAEEFEFEVDDNEGVIRSVVVIDQIKTVDQLLKLTGVGDEFIVHNPKVKKWDVALKLKVDKDKEIVKVVPSIYIEAPLRRKVPIAFAPVIAPIEIELPKLPKIGKQKKDGVKRGLILNDPQIGFRRTLHTTDLIPFHDRRVLDLALQICQEEQIDHISLGGDVNDLSEWSNKFMPEPEFYWTTQPALLETAWWLTQLRLARPHAEMKMLEGNHDLRMPLLLVANLRQAYKIKAVDELDLPSQMSIPRLLALHKLDVEYVKGYPDNGYWLNHNVYITHGDLVRGTPGGTANALANRQAFTTIFGHIHRRESVTHRMKTHDGDLIYTAFCPGAACHIDGRVPGSKSTDQWQQGLAVIEYTEHSENIIPIAIRDGEMIYNGRVWKARDREREIQGFLEKSLQGVSI